MITCGIYKITSPSKKIYIGQSIDVKKRLRHYKNAGSKEQTLLGRSLNKYGYNNHKIEIIHICTKAELNDLEIYYIQLYNCFNSKFGMNLKAGGQSGGMCSEEVKAKLRKPKSEAAKEKYRLSATGRIVSEETREKHRINMMGNKNLTGSKHMIGFKHSNETKAKIKEKRANQVMKKGYKRILSEAHILAMQKSAKKRIGTKHTPETIERMKIAQAGQKNPMSKTNVLKRKANGQSIFLCT